jgi:hypothetical protein
MTEEELNGPQVGAGFEEMYSECVPKRMWGDGFRETGQPIAPFGRLLLRRPS